MMLHTIIVTTDLLLVLALRVDDDLGKKDGKHVFEELEGEVHFCPVMTLFENLKNVAWRKGEKKSQHSHDISVTAHPYH